MADLFYPQLSSGAIAHYPVQKKLGTRTVTNVLPGGDVVMYPDDAAQKTFWSWEYTGIRVDEASTLQRFFDLCGGPLRPFTFLDPLGNLLSSSSDFRASTWQMRASVAISADLPGALPDTAAVVLVNNGQVTQEVLQTLAIPGAYWYCFSVYLRSATSDSVALFLRSTQSEKAVSVSLGLEWRRFWISGNLDDITTGLSVGVELLPGQQVSISAAQLEPQPSSSPYRSTRKQGDVYTNSHWLSEELSVRLVGPNSCAISVAIEG